MLYNSNMLIYYVYAYLRANGTPYYIGKGSNDRAWRKKRDHIPVPSDKSRIVIVESKLTEVGALAIERRLIAWHGRKIDGSGILINITPGGDGVSLPGELNGMYNRNHTSKTRAKQSAKRKGKTWEEIYGIEGAETKRKGVVGKSKPQPNYHYINHRNYDPTEYNFFNYSTGELITCTKYYFRTHILKSNNGVNDMFTRGWCAKNWGLIYT